MIRLGFVIPGSLDSPTGGTRYDRDVLARLSKFGIVANPLLVAACYPFPSDTDRLATKQSFLSASVDLFLIDDIQFLSNKPRTQEEFFYLFESLFAARKQIIVTCDTYPKEMSGVEDRLVSRFDSGLIVAIEPPDLETRTAILHRKAELRQVGLPDDVAFFVAKQIRSSVRELEGALNRIVAMSKFTGHQIDLHLAKEALKDLIAVRGRQITIENIQKTVADYFKIKVAEMYSKKRARNVARPRQIAMALTRELTNHSFPEIGEAFGSRHHTTVMHACDEIEQLRQNDTTVARDIGFLIQVIRD